MRFLFGRIDTSVHAKMAICDLIALLCLRLLEPGFSFYNVLCETLTHPQSNIPYDSYVNLVAAGL